MLLVTLAGGQNDNGYVCRIEKSAGKGGRRQKNRPQKYVYGREGKWLNMIKSAGMHAIFLAFPFALSLLSLRIFPMGYGGPLGLEISICS